MTDTFFSEIQPHIYRGGELTAEEFKELGEKTDEIGEKYAEDIDAGDGLFGVPLDKYYLSANPINVLCERKHLVEFHRGPNDIVFIPDFFINKPRLLKSIYGGVIVDGVVYSKRHNDVVRTEDTDRYVLKENVYDVMGRGFFEKKNNIVRIGTGDKYARKSDTVMTEDMGYRWMKGDCYRYYDEFEEAQYYRYRSLAPNSGRQIIRFNESIFPKPEDINESRIGIELEYKSAIEATRSVLLQPKYRESWSSVRDGSLEPDEIPREQEKSTEFVSVPLTINELGKVEDFMRFVKINGAKIDKRCGFHVHVGSPELTFDNLSKLVVLCINIEQELFKLVPDHRHNNEYCKRLDHSFQGFKKYVEGSVETEEEVADMFYEGKATAKNRAMQGKWNVRGKRHFWLSIDRFWYCKDEPHKRTVEFRMHHATHDSRQFIDFVLLSYYITQYAFNKTKSECRVATMDDIVSSIRNKSHYHRVENLLHNKKVIS